MQTFIQGLRPFSSSIPKTLKKHLRKGGYNYSNIVDNWTKMVSKQISDVCYPIGVKLRKESKEGTLVLNVSHGKEMEIEYHKTEIIDKINSFFGYECISNISLKIIQEKIDNHNKIRPKIKDFNKIEKKIKNLNNSKLKDSLSNFLRVYNEKTK